MLDGRVSPLLLWEKHPVPLVATPFLPLVLLLMLKRLLLGTRPKIVVQQRRAAARAAADAARTSETIADRPIEQGEMVYACAVSGANILRDMREAVVNTIGGHMTKYEALLDQTIARALEVLVASGLASRATTACSASASPIPQSPAAPSRWSWPARVSATRASRPSSGS